MGLAKRIIPCLDVAQGRVVKGVNFVNLRDAGDPVEVARRYDEQGADELAFLDIQASVETRGAALRHDRGRRRPGVHSVDRRRRRAPRRRHPRAANAGADKVSINTAGVKNPALIGDAAEPLRRAMHRRRDRRASSRSPGAGRSTRMAAATRPGSTRSSGRAGVVELGAGEILLTSMDRDGARSGFDLGLTRAVADAVDVPVIASGGVGTLAAIWSTAFWKAAPMRCSRPASSTMASTRSARPRRRWRPPGSRFATDDHEAGSTR